MNRPNGWRTDMSEGLRRDLGLQDQDSINNRIEAFWVWYIRKR